MIACVEGKKIGDGVFKVVFLLATLNVRANKVD
jgi:hypothetical protein